MTADSGNLVVLQRQLRIALRQAREQARHTQSEVAKAVGWSLSKMIRIETGAQKLSTPDARALLHFYNISGEQADNMLAITRMKEQAWWQDYRANYEQQGLLDFVAYEGAASRIQQFQGLVVPGLLQTADYTTALFAHISAVNPMSKPQRDVGVQVRLRRQEQVNRPGGPEQHYILDEAVLHRIVGNTGVMLAQLDQLKERQRQQEVIIQIIPFSAGPHAAMANSFTVLELSSEPKDYLVNLESSRFDTCIRDTPEAADECVNAFERMKQIALAPTESGFLIDTIATQLQGKPASSAGADSVFHGS